MTKKLYLIINCFLFALYLTGNAFADEVYLKNGDKISGEVLDESEGKVSLKTESMGTLTIDNEAIERIAKAAETQPKKTEEEKSDPAWKREIAIGYDKTTGNTNESRLAASGSINRNRKHIDEWTLKGEVYYSTNERKTNAQQWYTMGRYAYSLGKTKKWYNFYRLEADHDRFEDIGYRLLPAAGLGFWLFDTDDIKLMAEVGAGYEYTKFRIEDNNKEQWVLTPMASFEKKLFDKTRLKQNLFYYPAFEDFNDYRLRSETYVDVGINDKLSLRLSLIDDFTSEPAPDTKKNDLRLTSGLAYSF